MKIYLTKEESHYMTIVSEIVNRGKKYCSKDYGDREYVVSCSNIKINHVKVDGDAILCSGNVIHAGFKVVKDVMSGETGEVIGTRTEVTDVTAELWNSENLHHLSFETPVMNYEFVFHQ